MMKACAKMINDYTAVNVCCYATHVKVVNGSIYVKCGCPMIDNGFALSRLNCEYFRDVIE
jgi:hypothetical protein